MSVTTIAKPEGGEATAAEAQPAKKSKKKLVIILVVVLLALGGGGYWFTKPKAKAAPKAGTVVALDPIQINLEGEHYLRLGIALQLTASTKEVDGSKALDASIDEFSGLSLAAVTNPVKRRALKEELQKKLEKDYPDEVMGIYFTQFVTQ